MSDIDVNAIADVLNNKVDLAEGTNQASVDYVIESKYPTSEDPTWYRLYKSGWIEQGGYLSSIASGTAGVSVSFEKEMADTNYFSVPSWGSADYAALAVGNRATTGMKIFNRTNAANWCYWEVKGVSAQS